MALKKVVQEIQNVLNRQEMSRHVLELHSADWQSHFADWEKAVSAAACSHVLQYATTVCN